MVIAMFLRVRKIPSLNRVASDAVNSKPQFQKTVQFAINAELAELIKNCRSNLKLEQSNEFSKKAVLHESSNRS